MSTRLPNDPVAADHDLAALRGEVESDAREALGRMWARSLPFALNVLRRRGVLGADAEDVVQSAFVKIWETRGTVDARSLREWYALVRRRVRWSLYEHIEGRERQATAGEEEGIPEADLPYLDALVLALDERRHLYQSADDLWLGRTRDPDAQIGVAVLQLVLLNGLSPREAAPMFGKEENDVDRWLADGAILLRVLFHAVCWPNDELAGFVLRPSKPLSKQELDALGQGDVRTDWSPEDARVVSWRLRNGLAEERILRLAAGRIDRTDLDALIGRIRESLPFHRIVQALATDLEAAGRRSALAEPGVWKRTAFEYAVRYELPPRQIVERTGSSSVVAGYRVDAARINNWLSLGRLYAQLANYLEAANSA